MQFLSLLRSAKTRHKDCKVVRWHGRVYVICKTNLHFKSM
ncbi:MAG: 50S ribosomal protein L36 [Symbiopectobacterium sp.]